MRTLSKAAFLGIASVAIAGAALLLTDAGSVRARGTDPPETTILNGPMGPTRDGRPVFSFESDAGDAVFECSLDGGATYRSCSGPAATDRPPAKLADGAYVFAVRAVVGLIPDPTPATRRFRVDTRAKIRIKGRRLVLRRDGEVAVRVRCPALEAPDGCTGRVEIRAGRSGPRLAGVRLRVAAGRARPISLELGTRAQRRLRLGGPRQRVWVAAKTRDRAGNGATAGRRMSLAPLGGLTVALNPGHNGGNGANPSVINAFVPIGQGQTKACDTTGTATDGGYGEAGFNLDVAERLGERLRALGARVVMTRHDNQGVGPCIDERARIANRARAELALSIHADGGPAGGRGFHVIRPTLIPGLTDDIYGDSRRLAHAIRAGLDGSPVPRSNYVGSAGLDVRSDLGGLRLANVPAVFAELANMRNAADAAVISSVRGREAIARALLDGVRSYLARPG